MNHAKLPVNPLIASFPAIAYGAVLCAVLLTRPELPANRVLLLVSPLPLLLAWASDAALSKGEVDAAREGINPRPLRLMRWALWPGWLFAALTLAAAGLGAGTPVTAVLLAVAAACGLVMLGGLIWLAVIEYGPERKSRP